MITLLQYSAEETVQMMCQHVSTSPHTRGTGRWGEGMPYRREKKYVVAMLRVKYTFTRGLDIRSRGELVCAHDIAIQASSEARNTAGWPNKGQVDENTQNGA